MDFLRLAAVLAVFGVAAARAALTDYDATITADASTGPAPTAKLTNAVTFTGTNSFPFDFGAVTGDGTFRVHRRRHTIRPERVSRGGRELDEQPCVSSSGTTPAKWA